MLPLSRRIAVSANVIFFPCTRLEIKFILSYLILTTLFIIFVYYMVTTDTSIMPLSITAGNDVSPWPKLYIMATGCVYLSYLMEKRCIWLQ